MTADCDGELITPEHGIAARVLLNQTPLEIARNLAMSRETIERAIGKRRQTTSMTPRVAKRLRSYFERCGVEFLPDGQVWLKEGVEAVGDPTAADNGQNAALSEAGPQATATQLRAARRLLQWSQTEVAKANGWKQHRMSELERGICDRPQAAETLKKFYESVGVVFRADGHVHIDKGDE
jgi:hypothetical protein